MSPPPQTRDDDGERWSAQIPWRPESRAVAFASEGYSLGSRVEEAAVGSHVEQDEPIKEVVEGVGEALRSFMEEFWDQGEDSIILSPRLKKIITPDRPTALRFLGTHNTYHTQALLKYNNLMERYKKQAIKCSDSECEPRYNGLKKKYTDECAERWRLYNELIELRGSIRVFCRCRP